MAVSEGVLNVDKPSGMTSHDVVQRTRQLSRLRRVGHAGTLDPLATGVLLLCLGRATRLVEYLVELPKTYETSVRLGQATDTYDAEGTIVAERPIRVDRPQIEAALVLFRGSIKQRPPMYSAVRQAGRRLYKLARQQVEVERPWRDVVVYELELLAWEPPLLRLRIVCSAGTYVRSLAHDLGELLDCGGHVDDLRRCAIGPFTIEQAVPLSQLTHENLSEWLQPSDAAVMHLPRLDLTSVEATRLLQGQQVARSENQPLAPVVRTYDHEGRFIGIAADHPQGWHGRKMFLPPIA